LTTGLNDNGFTVPVYSPDTWFSSAVKPVDVLLVKQRMLSATGIPSLSASDQHTFTSASSIL